MNRTLFEKTFARQHDETDCGAACLLSLIRYYGGDSSIPHLRKISGTSIQGTTLLGLYQAAEWVSGPKDARPTSMRSSNTAGLSFCMF